MTYKKTDIAIIGAGASGLMLANRLKGKDFLLIDANAKTGAKLLISGGGKCNITNATLSFKNYDGNQKFVKNALKGYNNHHLIKWLKSKNLNITLRDNGGYFCTNSAKDIVNLLLKDIDKNSILLNCKVKKVEKKSNFLIETSKGTIEANKLVVASGGLSFAQLGASDIGYSIAKSFGIKVIETKPALVGFTLQKEQFFFKELSGISLEVIINLNNKQIKNWLLFAHKGISGPAILNASLYWQKGIIKINFLPNFNFEKILNSKKNISNLLNMPNRAAKAFIKALSLQDKQANKLTKDELAKLKSLQEYSFAPAGNFGYSKAEVTKGGVDTDEIDNNFMSKKVKNLYFIGEVLNVTGELGGYNLQWAFTSANLCKIYYHTNK